MNLKIRKLVTKLIGLVMLIVIFYGCEKEDILDKNNIVYSSKTKGMYVYKNSNLPTEIKKRLSKSEYEFICKISKNYGVIFLDPEEHRNLKLRELNLEDFDVFEKNLNDQITSIKHSQEEMDKNYIHTKNQRRGLKSIYNGFYHTDIGYISLKIAGISNNSLYSQGYVFLNWHYQYDYDREKALMVGSVSVNTVSSSIIQMHGEITYFSGNATVALGPSGIEFVYAVNGVIYVGVSIGGLDVGIPAVPIEKRGWLLCPKGGDYKGIG